jgi:GNAT superfamily N-acetyltransferase
MINAVLDIKLLGPDEWHVLRTTRLRALADSPHAFASHYEAEVRWSDDQWRQRLAAATWLVAVDSGAVIGIAGLVDEHVEAIWVERTHRQRGVFRALLRALVDLESGNGARDLVLWVLEDNREARQVYARLGFVPTRERQRLSDGRYELRLRLGITKRRS